MSFLSSAASAAPIDYIPIVGNPLPIHHDAARTIQRAWREHLLERADRLVGDFLKETARKSYEVWQGMTQGRTYLTDSVDAPIVIPGSVIDLALETPPYYSPSRRELLEAFTDQIRNFNRHGDSIATTTTLLRLGACDDFLNAHLYRPLHLAAQFGRTDIVRRLISAGATIDARTDENLTPLHLAAQFGRADTVRLLIELGATVNAKTDENLTPLYLAVKNRNTATVRVLIDGGADENITPLKLSATKMRYLITQLFLDAGADLDEQLHCAIANERFDMV